MIRTKHRFHGRGSLQYVYKRGKMVRTSSVGMKYVPNSRRRTYRLAVVVGRKVHKSAVVRNRIRRRIYESFRRREAYLMQPVDMVVTVFSEDIAIIPAVELERTLDRLLKSAGLMQKSPTARPSPPAHGIVKAEKDH